MKWMGVLTLLVLSLVGTPVFSDDGYHFKNGKCFGKFLTNRSLATLGFSETDLKIGVDCFQGDFDGTGNPAAALLSFAKAAKGHAMDATDLIRWKITVVFLDATGQVQRV